MKSFTGNFLCIQWKFAEISQIVWKKMIQLLVKLFKRDGNAIETAYKLIIHWNLFRRNVQLPHRTNAELDKADSNRIHCRHPRLQLQTVPSIDLWVCRCFHRKEFNNVWITVARIVGVMSGDLKRWFIELCRDALLGTKILWIIAMKTACFASFQQNHRLFCLRCGIF